MARNRDGTVTLTPDPEGEGAICGAKGAAEVLGVERTRIARYQREDKMPERIGKLKSGPVWLREDIEKMKEQRDLRA